MIRSMTVDPPPLSEQARRILQRLGNPFRNYFARNPDDEVCARYHVPELFAEERQLLQAIIDQYRYQPRLHSEVVPVLGNKGAGKTHLLHSIKHGEGGQWQLLVTPGVYQRDCDFLEYLLFQILDTLLGGGRQKGVRPLEYIGERLVRQSLLQSLPQLPEAALLEMFPAGGWGRWGRRFGWGLTQARQRHQQLLEQLHAAEQAHPLLPPPPLLTLLHQLGVEPERLLALFDHLPSEGDPRNPAGLMRRFILRGFAHAILRRDESELANFLTYGFAELDFHVRPTRQDLVLALFKVLMELFASLRLPVVVAFDQLEDLLLVRRGDDVHRTAEAFFAGIVQVLHQIDGLCFLIFAERGLWNRFVPSLDGYIQDRLTHPVHVAGYGTISAVRLEAPPPELVRQVIAARLRPCHAELLPEEVPSDIFPFREEQVQRIARTEPTLRDMLQQCRHLYDHLVYGPAEWDSAHPASPSRITPTLEATQRHVQAAGVTLRQVDVIEVPAASAPAVPPEESSSAPPSPEGSPPPEWLRDSAETPLPSEVAAPIPREIPSSQPKGAEPDTALPSGRSTLTPSLMAELWDQEQRTARRQLEPDGALTGASRELQAALGQFLMHCLEHGVKVGPWRLQHVVPEYVFSDHPTYGVVSLGYWACKDGQPWKVAVGLFLARGAGKPRELEIKFSLFEQQPAPLDLLILLRPEDDLSLTGRSKKLWDQAEQKGQLARLEPVSLDTLAQIYAFPRWLAALRESLPEGVPLPNLADLIQQKCEHLLTQVCMPVHT
jgi:hypothetical protein